MVLQGCACSAGADFQHRRSGERDGAGEDGHRNCNVFVRVGHVNFATTYDAIKHCTDDTQKQPRTHATSGEEQRGEHNAHR